MPDIRGLGYLEVQTRDLARWRELTVDCLGFAVGNGPDPDALYLRMDERRSRLVVRPGEDDRVLAVGWEVRDQFALAAISDRVIASGTGVKELTPEVCDERGVEAGITFADPAGTPVEVFFAPLLDHSPVVTGMAQHFVTEEQGMGHVVLPTLEMEDTVAFYTEVMGFLPRGAMKLGAPPKGRAAQRVRFMGVTPGTTAWPSSVRRTVRSRAWCT